jgi:ribosomal protein L7/L12
MTDTIGMLVSMLAEEREKCANLSSQLAEAERRHAIALRDASVSVMDQDQAAREIGQILGGNKIAAIKMHRHLARSGLKDAKDAVERHWPSGVPLSYA